MAGARLDFSSGKAGFVPKGADFERVFTFTDSLGVAIDLSGCYVYSRVKKETLESTKAIAQLIAVVDGPAGKITLSLPMEDVNKLPTTGKDHDALTRYTWDMFIEWSDGKREQVFYGFFDVMPRATEIEAYV